MNVPPLERRTRAILPIIRFIQTAIPLPLARLLINWGRSWMPQEAGVHHKTVSADGVPCEWIIPEESRTDQVLLYLHGGGFVFGVTPQHLQMCAYLAKKMGIRVLVVDYRLAPRNPFPAALDDCFNTYRWLLEQGVSANRIVIAGDSAGGNLTLTLMMRVRDRGFSLPAAGACLSPVVDLTAERRAREGFKDPLLPDRAIRLYNRSYVGDRDARDPFISPIFGDLSGLPPLLVHVGEDEILRQDASRITALAESAGVDVRLEIYPRMWHVWQIFPALPQATQSLDDIAGFLRSNLDAVANQIR